MSLWHLFGLALLVWLAFRGWSVLLPAPAAVNRTAVTYRRAAVDVRFAPFEVPQADFLARSAGRC
jgi:hypothetical protein